MSFSADISKFIGKTKTNADLVVRKVVVDLTASIIRRTPVDTGNARASWQVGKDIPAGKDTRGSQSVSWAKAGDIIFIANNVHYIRPLEYGYSKQAPHGMVRITARLFQRYIRNAVRRLR